MKTRVITSEIQLGKASDKVSNSPVNVEKASRANGLPLSKSFDQDQPEGKKVDALKTGGKPVEQVAAAVAIAHKTVLNLEETLKLVAELGKKTAQRDDRYNGYIDILKAFVVSQNDVDDMAPNNTSFKGCELLSFYTSVASVYFSKIEWESIELDSYIKHKRFHIEFQPNYTLKVDDLYLAYQFASENKPDKETFAEMHTLLAKHIVSTNYLGKYRNQKMFVTPKDGRIEYVAASPFEVPSEMDKFYADLMLLLNLELTISEVFFFASMIHLVFVKIHPWNDGNGRSGRLLEK